jgi:hypothetical protein
MTTPLDYMGIAPLVLGPDTQLWRLEDFICTVRHALTYGFTSLLVQVANGPTRWYNHIAGGWHSVLQTVKEAGLAAIPYIHSNGRRKFHHKGGGGLEIECEMLAELLGEYGIAVAHMHAEYNNKPEWGADMCRIMREVPGLFGVMSWGDPSWQKWDGVLRALNPCVDFYMPQVCNGFVSTIYKRDYNLYRRPYYPVLNMGVDAGPNNIVSIAAESGSPIVAFRQYARLARYAEPVREIIGMLKEQQRSESGEHTAVRV